MIIRTYSELRTLKTFEERFRYLKLNGSVGRETFGFDRYLNQMFYSLDEWKELRNHIITRDNGCDLGVCGYDIHTNAIIHHMNAISREDIINHNPDILDPRFLITTRLSTHNAIHYGNEKILATLVPIERTKNDTCPWRR